MQRYKIPSARQHRAVNTRLAALALASAALTAPALAVRVGDVELPDHWPIDGQTLALNGAGVREYGFLRIAVYAAALYLPQPCGEPAALLALVPPDLPVVLHLRMLRSVGRRESAKAWTHYLRGNCHTDCQIDDGSLQRFLTLTPDAPAGDTQTYIWRSGSLEILRNGQSLGVMNQHADRTLQRLVLASWIGSQPSTPELKKTLLGAGRCR